MMTTKNYTYDSDHKLLAVESYFPKYRVKFDRSKGEKMISKWLKKHKIHFKSEYSFPNLKAIKRLRYDFAILDDNDNVNNNEYIEPFLGFNSNNRYINLDNYLEV